MYPDGYAPSRLAPIDDFLAKLVAVKVVIDGGTSQERTHILDPSEMVRTDIHAEEVNPGAWGSPYPMASLLPSMPAVSVGEHTFEPILVLSAQHCDGLGSDADLQCFPAGETSFGVRPISITTPER